MFSEFFYRISEYLQYFISEQTKLELMMKMRLRILGSILECQVPLVTANFKL